MIIHFDKAILLAFCLPGILSVMQCEASSNEASCLPDCDIVRQEIQKFYCTATQMYEEINTVRLSLFHILFSYIAIFLAKS